MKQVRTALLALGALLLVVLIALSLFPIRIPVHETPQARRLYTHPISGDAADDGFQRAVRETQQPISLEVEGTYEVYLFRPDRFSGQIRIADDPATGGEVDVTLTPDGANLIYRTYRGSRLESTYFGLLTATFGMRDLLILKAVDGALSPLEYEAILTDGYSDTDADEFLAQTLS